MKSTVLIATIAILAASASTPLVAADRKDVRTAGYDHGMQEIANAAQPGQSAHGWRYFSDHEARRAIVISPEGNYYLSRGKGLRWIAGAPTSAQGWQYYTGLEDRRAVVISPQGDYYPSLGKGLRWVAGTPTAL